MWSYLQPHDQRQMLVLCRRAVSVVEPPEHVGPVSHLHIVPGFFASRGTGEPCVGFKQTRCLSLVLSQDVPEKYYSTKIKNNYSHSSLNAGTLQRVTLVSVRTRLNRGAGRVLLTVCVQLVQQPERNTEVLAAAQ